MKIFEIIWGLVAIILFLLLISGIAVSMITHNMCKNECIDKGTRFYELLPNGKWFSLQDMCVCHFKDKPEIKFVLSGEGG